MLGQTDDSWIGLMKERLGETNANEVNECESRYKDFLWLLNREETGKI